MKPKLKVTLVLFLVIVSNLGIQAQKGIIGLELGTNIISTQKTSISNDFNLGAYGGFNFKYQINDAMAIKSGLFYSQRKKRYAIQDTSSLFDGFGGLFGAIGIDSSLLDIPGVDTDIYTNTAGMITGNYIELPVLFSYSYKGFALSAGPYIGFLMNVRRKEKIITEVPFLQVMDVSALDSSGTISSFLPNSYTETTNESSSIDNLRRFDYGFSFGLGYAMENVQFNLQYTLGLPGYRIDNGGSEKDSHKAFRFSVVYYFDFSESPASL